MKYSKRIGVAAGLGLVALGACAGPWAAVTQGSPYAASQRHGSRPRAADPLATAPASVTMTATAPATASVTATVSVTMTATAPATASVTAATAPATASATGTMTVAPTLSTPTATPVFATAPVSPTVFATVPPGVAAGTPGLPGAMTAPAGLPTAVATAAPTATPRPIVYANATMRIPPTDQDRVVYTPPSAPATLPDGERYDLPSAPSAVSRAQAIQAAEDAVPGLGQEAVQVVAQYVLFTDNGHSRLPVWVVSFEGILDSGVGGKWGVTDPKYTAYDHEANIVIDATTGQRLLEFLYR